jgi:serine/threonine protein kinase
LSGYIQVQLTITSGKEIGRRYALKLGQTFILGRSKKVAIRLRSDDLISRQHASVELRPDGIFVTDLGSRNGTFIGGERLEPHVPRDVTTESVLEVGNHTLEFKMLGVAGEEDMAETQAVGIPLLPRDEFELLGLIGEGATGKVFAAEQKLMRRKVAIKVLNQRWSRDPNERERFLREGWICSQIESPHVVEVYDVRAVRGQVCMIMELVQGPSAQDRLKDGPLPVREALKIGEDVALALQAAGEANVIHRDVKPSNILLDPRGIAKLTDFGIAKHFGAPVDDAELTPVGEGMGTMAYVSPEQANEARDANMRSDIYGLGASLYHLLCGRPPFQPKSACDLFRTLKEVPKPLSSFTGLASPIPEILSEFVQAMLSKDPIDRPHPPSFVAKILHDFRLESYPGTASHKKSKAWETGEIKPEHVRALRRPVAKDQGLETPQTQEPTS